MSIKTDKYSTLNPVQKKAADAVGFTAKNVAYLYQKGIEHTKIWLPNPNYLARVLGETGNDSIWRASWFDSFLSFSYFLADENINNFSRLRGVRREASVSEPSAPLGADAQKLPPTLDQVLACLGEDIAPSVRPAVERRIRELYPL